MEQNLGNAISIMLVGMATVFLILWLVVIIGNLIIRITNKYFSTSEPVKVQNTIIQSGAEKSKIAAIFAAVDIATNGKGRITKITKV